MIAGIVLIILIVLYMAFVIRKKHSDFKNGNGCGCGCSGCTNTKKCSKSDKSVLK